MRIGFGYDVHRLEAGRRFVICGVEIPGDLGSVGHSDADVATHALMDAMLGALAFGDIGKHFPDTDNKWKDADSILMLGHVFNLVRDKGYKLGNADITIVLQAPRIAPFIESMRLKIAQATDADIRDISVKATTEEGLGFTGEKSGVSAYAVVLLVENK